MNLKNNTIDMWSLLATCNGIATNLLISPSNPRPVLTWGLAISPVVLLLIFGRRKRKTTTRIHEAKSDPPVDRPATNSISSKEAILLSLNDIKEIISDHIITFKSVINQRACKNFLGERKKDVSDLLENVTALDKSCKFLRCKGCKNCKHLTQCKKRISNLLETIKLCEANAKLYARNPEKRRTALQALNLQIDGIFLLFVETAKVA